MDISIRYSWPYISYNFNFYTNENSAFGYGFITAPAGALASAIFDKNMEEQYSMRFVLTFIELLILISR